MKTSPAEFSEFRHFLDGSQYTTNGILRYEQMFGAGYVSTGGAQTTEDLLTRIKLNKGEAVLDVGMYHTLTVVCDPLKLKLSTIFVIKGCQFL